MVFWVLKRHTLRKRRSRKPVMCYFNREGTYVTNSWPWSLNEVRNIYYTRIHWLKVLWGGKFVPCLQCKFMIMREIVYPHGFQTDSGIDRIWAASWQNQQNGMCAQRRLRSAWASAQSDQSSLSLWRKLGSLPTHLAHSEDWSDWADDLSLRWAHSHCVGFVTRSLILSISLWIRSLLISLFIVHEVRLVREKQFQIILSRKSRNCTENWRSREEQLILHNFVTTMFLDQFQDVMKFTTITYSTNLTV